jgi:protein-S-isoprenylcysteine O-methyltransferase Ste14
LSALQTKPLKSRESLGQRLLIRMGPYRAMRHPIYVGMLLGLPGTAVVVGEVRSLLALVILGLGFYVKTRKEEAFLSREFAAGF